MIPLGEDERDALAKYASFEITLDQLRERLRSGLEFDFDGPQRTLTDHFEIPKVGVRIGRWHLENALDKRRRGEVTERELADWASMLVMNGVYDWRGPDEDEIADWLHDLSYLPGESDPST